MGAAEEKLLHRHPILAMLAFAGLSGAIVMLLLVLVSKQPFEGGPLFALFGGALTGSFLAVLFHVPPFRQLVRFGAKIGGAVDEEIERSGGLGCTGIVMLPFVACYYILSWPGIKLAEKLGYIRMMRDKE